MPGSNLVTVKRFPSSRNGTAISLSRYFSFPCVSPPFIEKKIAVCCDNRNVSYMRCVGGQNVDCYTLQHIARSDQWALTDCTALHCTALHCTALHCTALYCTALHCTVLHCTALHCTALHFCRPSAHHISHYVTHILTYVGCLF